MAEFTVDLRDIKFALMQQAGIGKLFKYDRHSELDEETIAAILDEAYKFAKGQMAPLNTIADREGAKFNKADNTVTMPGAFQETYRLFCENGWLGLNHNTDYGGQGMPYALALATNDMFFGACLAFSLQGLLTVGTAHLIEVFGTDELKRIYLEKMYSGQWAGTMCLTESGAGSDVGAARTKATRQGDHYLIEGEKIFITYGEHDLTENIGHAVLARLEGAPAGTAGLSLFLVPKFLVNSDGSLGARNDVKVVGMEHKMGIHGSPTCTMSFGEAGNCVGYLLGQENKGMRAMFQMMNEARISVGLQGAALANAAYQYALAFAKERIQSKSLLKARDPEAGPVPIIEHADVRQMLMWQKALAEGTRALLYRAAVFYDTAEVTQDAEEREKYEGLLGLLTPICKAYASDQGFRVTELALQTLGGYGYVSEYPVEQYMRDSKIASIYEGTNGIQALDLVGRKLPSRGGQDIKNLLGMVGGFVGENASHPLLGASVAKLGKALEALTAVTMHFAGEAASNPMSPVLNATPYLDLFGQTLVGWLLLEAATLAQPQLETLCKNKGIEASDSKSLAKLCGEDEEAKFLDGKVKVAQFYAARALPLVAAKADTLKSGDMSALTATL